MDAPKRRNDRPADSSHFLYSVWDEGQLQEYGVNTQLKSVTGLWKYLLNHPSATWDTVEWNKLNLPRDVENIIKDNFHICTSKIVHREDSKRGDTSKLLIELQDGHRIETVVMNHKGHSTVCVSSQIGCKMGCKFCATGTLGIIGDLSAGEILEQLNHANAISTIRNVVFMGMGEPLNNYKNVKFAVEFMIDTKRYSLSPKHVTVSTVGVISAMRRLTDDLGKVNLALSLHAPNQEVRLKIVPAAKAHVIDKLIAAVDYHIAKNRAVVNSDEIDFLKDIRDGNVDGVGGAVGAVGAVGGGGCHSASDEGREEEAGACGTDSCGCGDAGTAAGTPAGTAAAAIEPVRLTAAALAAQCRSESKDGTPAADAAADADADSATVTDTASVTSSQMPLISDDGIYNFRVDVAISKRKDRHLRHGGGQHKSSGGSGKIKAPKAQKEHLVMIEYILIRDVNDKAEHAKELVQLLGPRKANLLLNLIPYNPTDVPDGFEPSLPESIQRFFEICAESGLFTRVRQEMGTDIAGACGQLALVTKAEKKAQEAAKADKLAAAAAAPPAPAPAPAAAASTTTTGVAGSSSSASSRASGGGDIEDLVKPRTGPEAGKGKGKGVSVGGGRVVRPLRSSNGGGGASVPESDSAVDTGSGSGSGPGSFIGSCVAWVGGVTTVERLPWVLVSLGVVAVVVGVLGRRK